jgi:hypothetical protein
MNATTRALLFEVEKKASETCQHDVIALCHAFRKEGEHLERTARRSNRRRKAIKQLQTALKRAYGRPIMLGLPISYGDTLTLVKSAGSHYFAAADTVSATAVLDAAEEVDEELEALAVGGEVTP